MSKFPLFVNFLAKFGFDAVDETNGALKKGELEIDTWINDEVMSFSPRYKGAHIQLPIACHGESMSLGCIESVHLTEKFFDELGLLVSTGAFEREGQRIENVTFATATADFDVQLAFDMATGSSLNLPAEFLALAKSHPNTPVRLLADREIPNPTNSITASNDENYLLAFAFERNASVPVVSVTCRTWRDLASAAAKYVVENLRPNFACFADSVEFKNDVAVIGWSR